MTAWVALLRAVNVGGKNRLPMADFRAALTKIGATQVQTYIQSGNAVFCSGLSSAELAQAIADEIDAHAGFRPATIVISREALAAAIAALPFVGPAVRQPDVHFGFLDAPLAPEALARLEATATVGEAVVPGLGVLYLSLPLGVGKSKLAGRVMSLPQSITMRNLRTVLALREMAAGIA